MILAAILATRIVLKCNPCEMQSEVGAFCLSVQTRSNVSKQEKMVLLTEEQSGQVILNKAGSAAPYFRARRTSSSVASAGVRKPSSEIA